LKTNSKTLATFLSKVTVNGSMTDALLRFGPDGLSVTVKDITNAGSATGLLKPSNFLDYAAIGNVPIKNTELLLSVLKNMNGNVEIVLSGNILQLTSEKSKAELVLMEEQHLECNLDPSKLTDLLAKFDSGFTIDASVLQAAKKNVATLATKSIVVSIDNGTLNIQAGEDNFDKLTITDKVAYKNVSTRYGPTFLDFIGAMSGPLTITMDSNFPMLIVSKDADSYVKWVVVPIVQTEETKQEA
jgi:hypothetical protein